MLQCFFFVIKIHVYIVQLCHNSKDINYNDEIGFQRFRDILIKIVLRLVFNVTISNIRCTSNVFIVTNVVNLMNILANIRT